MAIPSHSEGSSTSPCEHGSYKRQAFADFRESLMPPFAVGASVAARSRTRIKSIFTTEGTGVTEEDAFPL